MRPPAREPPDETLGIVMLNDCECIRRRPAMYIGDTGANGLHHLVDELLTNSLDQARAGCCTFCVVELLADGGCRVTDDGAGIPVDRDAGTGTTVLEVFLTRVGCAGPPGSPYRWIAGLHGHGLKAVNALSERLLVEVQRDGKRWRQEYRRGQPCGPLLAVGDADRTGTAITFWPDPDIFSAGEVRRFDFSRLETRLLEQSFFHPLMTFRLTDRRPGSERAEVFHHPCGLCDFVRHLNRDRRPVHPHIFPVIAWGLDGEVETAMQWTADEEGVLRSYVNGRLTSQGGSHLDGLCSAIRMVVDELLYEKGLRRRRPSGRRWRAGLTAVVAVNLRAPRFAGATKDQLISDEAEMLVHTAVSQHLPELLRDHPADAQAIAAHVLAAASRRC